MQTMVTLTRNQVIAAAAGTLQVLEALSRGDGPMTLAQLLQATGRPKGTVHRMLSTLVNTGFATYARASGVYALTLKAWRIGSSALRDFDLANVARPVLDGLRSETGETVHLSVLETTGRNRLRGQGREPEVDRRADAAGAVESGLVHGHRTFDPGARRGHRRDHPVRPGCSSARRAR